MHSGEGAYYQGKTKEKKKLVENLKAMLCTGLMRIKDRKWTENKVHVFRN